MNGLADAREVESFCMARSSRNHRGAFHVQPSAHSDTLANLLNRHLFAYCETKAKRAGQIDFSGRACLTLHARGRYNSQKAAQGTWWGTEGHPHPTKRTREVGPFAVASNRGSLTVSEQNTM